MMSCITNSALLEGQQNFKKLTKNKELKVVQSVWTLVAHIFKVNIEVLDSQSYAVNIYSFSTPSSPYPH